jgi:hypothetical protein
MIIKYADNHTWRKTIHPDIFPDFGKNSTKKLKSCLDNVETLRLSHKFGELDENFFTWFQPMYDTQIANRKNFGGYDIFATTLGKADCQHTYQTLTLLENGTPIGGAIFTRRKVRVSIVYRAFFGKFVNGKTRCTPALYAEYLLHKEALRLKLPDLTHGADKNPYGINSAIGLAIFKLSVGCTARLQRQRERHQIDITTLTQDALVLEYPETGDVITKGHLVTTRANQEKYEQLLKYPDLLTITTHLY